MRGEEVGTNERDQRCWEIDRPVDGQGWPQQGIKSWPALRNTGSHLT